MNILFVCAGNTCRSCMAEAIFNEVCNKENFISFSAGISAVPGSIISKNSSQMLTEKLNLNIKDREAVQLNEDLIKNSDLILAMTASVKAAAINYFNITNEKLIYTLNEYVKVHGEVADPYGGNLSTYEKVYDQLYTLINLLIEKLIEDKSMNLC